MSPRRQLRPPTFFELPLYDPADHGYRPLHKVVGPHGNIRVPLPFSTNHHELSTVLTDAIQPPTGLPPAQLSLVQKKDDSCRRTTQPSYLNIPARILKGKHLTNINKTTLCDPSGRLWTVDINQRSDGRVVLSQGWFQFCEANLVQEGDICIFEVAGGIQAMDVQIRRLELPHVATD
ncbi:B3 domain-containing protein [Platanthera zijinensis]|uniref:B3 domain-containing protein n=1 Tax=Platanthera zijinensis TaxID=2320716 RepID=A0AAP0BMS3_9ASPA